MSAQPRSGLYVHIPFCLTRCGYCDFNAYAGLGHMAEAYVRALRTEIRLTAPDWGEERFASVFFGGGTPTTLPPQTLAGLLRECVASYPFERVPEITVEANPETIDRAYVEALIGAGLTRLSMGVQSFDPRVLQSLGRVHGPDSVRTAVAAVRAAGVPALSLDLIYGARGEDEASWSRTLEEALALAPEHVSCYALTIEAATPLGRAVAEGAEPAPDPDLQADRYEMACQVLRDAGYVHYEVSNWARPGHESIHNKGYWQRRPYLGLGAGAHSARGGKRWWNVRPPQAYIAALASSELPIGGTETVGPEQERLEVALLGLRTRWGIPAEDSASARVLELVDARLVERTAGRVVATERGMFLANELVSELVR